MKGLWIYDTESDGLAGNSIDPEEKMTKFHCLLFKEYKKDAWVLFLDQEHDEYEEAKTFAEKKEVNLRIKNLKDFPEWVTSEPCALACQNQFGFDLKAFKQAFQMEYSMFPETLNGSPIKLYDTLSMSRTLWPDRMLPFGCPAKVKNPSGGKAKTIGAHSLEAWGYKLANQKVAIEDWRGLPLWKYVDRVWEDVIINELQWEALIKEMSLNCLSTVSWRDALRRGTVSDSLMALQEEQGVTFDEEKAWELLSKIDTMMKSIAGDVEPKLPLKDVPKSRQPNFPKDPFDKSGNISHYGWQYAKNVLGYNLNEEFFNLVPPPKTAFKKDSSLSANGKKYCIKHGIEDEALMPDFIRSQLEKVSVEKPLPNKELDNLTKQLQERYVPSELLKEPMKLSNQEDIKEWLVREGGWKPTLFNTKDVTRDDNKQNRPEKDIEDSVWNYIQDKKDSLYEPFLSNDMGISIRTITTRKCKKFNQLVRKGRFLLTSPKLKDERGELCPNLERIDGVMAKQIVKWLSLRNRRAVIKSLDEDKTTGWLNHPRLKVDGKLPARYSGLTNTFRRKHAVIANVPSTEALLGHEMRDLFTVPRGYWQLGIDGSNLEGMCAAWAAYDFDGGAYLEIMESGDAHTRNAEAYSSASGRVVSRQGGKGITYGIMYGAQAAKIATMLGVSREVGQDVIDAFWDSNIGLKKRKEFLEKQWESTKKKYIVGVDGRKVHTRSKHSLLNCYLQSAGAIGMDLAGNIWHEKCLKEGLLDKGVARTIFYHDEYQLQVPEELMRWKKFDTEVRNKKTVKGILKDLKESKSNEKKGRDFLSKEDVAEKNKVTLEQVISTERADSDAMSLKVDNFMLSANTFIFDSGKIGRCYSRAGVLMVEAIEEAYQQLNCPVHITGEYLCGKTWGDCH